MSQKAESSFTIDKTEETPVEWAGGSVNRARWYKTHVPPRAHFLQSQSLDFKLFSKMFSRALANLCTLATKESLTDRPCRACPPCWHG